MSFEASHDPDAKPGQRGHMSAYVSPFGKSEGMAARLRAHVKKLGTDKSLPWVGLGLIADLNAAATMIDGQPSPMHGTICEGRGELFAQLAAERPANVAFEREPAVEDWERALPAASVEFDL